MTAFPPEEVPGHLLDQCHSFACDFGLCVGLVTAKWLCTLFSPTVVCVGGRDVCQSSRAGTLFLVQKGSTWGGIKSRPLHDAAQAPAVTSSRLWDV